MEDFSIFGVFHSDSAIFNLDLEVAISSSSKFVGHLREEWTWLVLADARAVVVEEDLFCVFLRAARCHLKAQLVVGSVFQVGV